MAPYRKSEAREWAKAHLRGVANVIIPTFTQDLQGLNERAIRHDVRREIELGFWGALLVAETATSLPEYGQFAQWAVDEARGKLHLIHHASFNTLTQNIEAARLSEQAGAELVLLSYPSSFYPKQLDDVFNYTREFCAQTNLGVMLFPVPLWGFERLHPAGMPIELLRRMVDGIPNVVAIKAEGGYPTIGGFVETYKALKDRVVVTSPVEADGLPLAALVPMQFMGTSNSEYYGATVPRIFALLQREEWQQAMALYWQIHPARMTNFGSPAIGAANAINRMVWKYQGWLNGFNGGPLRQPTQRIVANQMRAMRQGLLASGLQPTDSPDDEFFIGRNPA